MRRYRFHLHILPEAYVDYYRGVVRSVVVITTAGQSLEFPASLLVKFVTREGIEGDFVLTCDDKNKCIELERG
jgi:hypothetical protein